MSTANDRTLAAHVLVCMIDARDEREAPTLESIAARVSVRRNDVRRVLSSLHREGLVDVLRMRLTLAGLAAGAALSSVPLRPVRRPRAAAVAA